MTSDAKKMFVIDMRHDYTSESVYEVRETWEDALAVARKYWEDADQEYNENAKQPFKVGDGYAEELDVTIKHGTSLMLMHACGDGAYIRIAKVKSTRSE